MKRICILLVLALLLTGCTVFRQQSNVQPSRLPDVLATRPTAPPATVPPTAQPEETTVPPTTQPEETEPLHSEFYIPGLSVEDVIRYFNEVCLDAEFSEGGNASLVQKWDDTIFYQIHGECTEEDLAMLENFMAWLNEIEGFPGFEETDQAAITDLNIYFCTEQEMLDHLGDNFYGCDGGVTFWYDGNNVIYEAIICYRRDLNQHVRNSVILEEIYNGLGPVQDTWLREDSIIYAGYSEPQALTEIDRLILRLLYHPMIRCGMNSEECEAVIRQLYY